MTDKYTLEEIERVFQRIRESGHSTADGKSIICSFDLLRELLTRPKHEFRHGEVIAFPTGEYMKYHAEAIATTARPLRLSEMPRAVEDLRSALAHIAGNFPVSPRHYAGEAIAKFDAEIEK